MFRTIFDNQISCFYVVFICFLIIINKVKKMNDLPSEIDLLVIGTGFVESVIAAAASRIGKSVLHLDTNDHYGGQWASFNLQGLLDLSNSKPLTAFNNPNFNLKNFDFEWLREDQKDHLLTNSRKFNIDLAPKLHFCRGDFVQLLITSNIARYAEFRSVSRVLTWLNGRVELVPCSRSDVFASQKVSVIEKRVLMKLLTSLDDVVVIDSEKDQKFKSFLEKKELSPSLVNYVMTMAGASELNTLEEGLKGVKRYLKSLGRFGKTPYLFSMYGSGEIAQAFCRLSAVFGGVYALNQHHLTALKAENNRITSLTTKNQEIRAENYVLSLDKCSEDFVGPLRCAKYISRAVLITDKSILPDEHEHLSFLTYPEDNGRLIRVLELGSLTGTCPKDYYLVHLTAAAATQTTSPREDFSGVLENLFSGSERPQIVFACYFSLPDASGLEHARYENLVLCPPGPDDDLDYDGSLRKARDIFCRLYPEMEFLPRAPDPEEIVIGD